MDEIISTISEMLREGLELDMPYTAIEGTLQYIEDIYTIGERVNE